jgi:hypothetical protein
MDVSAASSLAAQHLARAVAHVRTEVLSAAADKLGITVDRLRAEIAAGQPLSDLLVVASASVDKPAPVVVEQEHGSTVDVLL